MRIALVQQHATKNKADNIARGIKALEKAVSQGAKLICYPELAFDFFIPQQPATPKSVSLAESIPGPTTELFSKKAKEHEAVIILNIFEIEGTRTYDSSPVINSDGQITGKHFPDDQHWAGHYFRQ